MAGHSEYLSILVEEIMSLIKKMCRQDALYFQKTGVDGYGDAKFAAPVQIKCRWEDVVTEFIGTDGTKQASKSVVYVLQDVKPGDKLMLGTVAPANENAEGVWEIKQFAKVPNLKATEFLRTCFL